MIYRNATVPCPFGHPVTAYLQA